MPRFGEPARFGTVIVAEPVLIDIALRQGPGEDYGANASSEGLSAFIPLIEEETTFWGTPADESHDGQRITPYEALKKV